MSLGNLTENEYKMLSVMCMAFSGRSNDKDYISFA